MVDREELLHGGDRSRSDPKRLGYGKQRNARGLRRVHVNSGGERCIVLMIESTLARTTEK